MALKKSIDTNVGVPALYWNISDDRRMHRDRMVIFAAQGFATEEARRAGKQPLAEEEFRFQVADGEDMDAYTRPKLYDWLKSQDKWKGAVKG